jgi:hypothetical protein
MMGAHKTELRPTLTVDLYFIFLFARKCLLNITVYISHAIYIAIHVFVYMSVKYSNGKPIYLWHVCSVHGMTSYIHIVLYALSKNAPLISTGGPKHKFRNAGSLADNLYILVEQIPLSALFHFFDHCCKNCS